MRVTRTTSASRGGGQLYQIDVALGTLDDSELTLRDSDGWRLGSNDDHGDSSASRIVWRAPDAR